METTALTGFIALRPCPSPDGVQLRSPITCPGGPSSEPRARRSYRRMQGPLPQLPTAAPTKGNPHCLRLSLPVSCFFFFSFIFIFIFISLAGPADNVPHLPSLEAPAWASVSRRCLMPTPYKYPVDSRPAPRAIEKKARPEKAGDRLATPGLARHWASGCG